MRVSCRALAPAICALSFAAACQSAPVDEPHVAYLDGPPIGAWSPEMPSPAGMGTQGGMQIAGGIGGASGAGGASGVGGGDSGVGSAPSMPAGVSQLRFSVVTRELGGKYAPKNIGAIWVRDATGRRVRTLELWASIRRRYLTQWNIDTGGDRTDVVSRATLRMHEPHEVVRSE